MLKKKIQDINNNKAGGGTAKASYYNTNRRRNYPNGSNAHGYSKDDGKFSLTLGAYDNNHQNN